MPITASSRHGIIRAVMREFAKKTLRSGSGQTVTDRRQAIAIALKKSRTHPSR